jgi:hypothetical protein
MHVRFWPFPVKPESEWTDFDREVVDFFQRAFDEGFFPRIDEGESCITLGEGIYPRGVSVVRRGTRNGWEPFLSESGIRVPLGPSYRAPLGTHACVCVRPPFRNVAYFALEWMRGESLEDLLGQFEFVGGYPAGIALRSPWASPV